MLKKNQFTLSQIQNLLIKKANPKKAIFLSNYLRADHYGLSDRFLGLAVPEIRNISHQVGDLSFSDLKSLINSRIHEERFLAVVNLVAQFQMAQKNQQTEQTKLIFEFYLEQMLVGIDNWDLVDASADKIVGSYLIDKPQLTQYYLYEFLAPSSNLWQRKIAVLATFYFIRKSHFANTIKLAELFLNDSEGLIHKSVGWMLREVGKKDEKTLINFLEKNCQKMPRVMLRYSLEKLEPKLKFKYLKQKQELKIALSELNQI